MKWNLVTAFFIAAVSIALLAAVPGAGKASDAPQKFNLADLADGETRTFGEGDHAITATRNGDDVTITYKGDSKAGTHTLHCTAGKDSCFATILGTDGKTPMVMLSKSGPAGGNSHPKVATKVVLLGDDADPKKLGDLDSDDESGDPMVVSSDDSGMVWVTSDEDTSTPGTHSGVRVIKIVTDAGTVLRCPEGDATLTLKKGEENTGPYFCPRHNLKMEPSKDPVVISQKIKLEKHSGTQDQEY